MNRDRRKSLIEKYLNADTEPAEERLLAEWFAAHGAEEDEAPVARLILAEYPEARYEAASRKFDVIMASHNRRSRSLWWTCMAAACATLVAGLCIFWPQREACEFDALEMAQGIEKIMLLDMENVESITARPVGHRVILTAVLYDGSKCSYIMSKDKTSSAISITAMK